jgi:CRISPR-associated endonuclease/helicase Cas3
MNGKRETLALAHVRQDNGGDWHEHLLDEHLRGVAAIAADFGTDFDSSDWASLAGLWHDLGKFREKFQRYIKSVSGYEKRYDTEAHIKDEETPGRVDHSTAGAIHAIEKMELQGRILAYLIAGHHAGLPDWNNAESGHSSLFNRVEEGKVKGYLQEALNDFPSAKILEQPRPASLPPDGSLAL